MIRSQTQRFLLVDILRGFAALLVVFYHVLSARPWPNFGTIGIGKLPSVGWVGVDLFLVISGFVIGKTALDAHGKGLPWRQHYFHRRVTRVVPLYVATLAIWVFLINPQLLDYEWASIYHIGMHLGFVHNLWHETHGSINPPNWSVGLEMQFYLLMAICAPWIARTRLWKMLALWIATAWAWKYGSTLIYPPAASTPIVQFIYASQLPGVLDEFVFGICIARLAQTNALHFTWSKFVGWAAVAITLLSTAWITVPLEQLYWKDANTIIFWRTLVCAGFAALLACVVMIPYSGGWGLRPFRYLGEISYGIYLWHMPVLVTFVAKTQWQGLQLLLATVACTITLAALSWHGFEKLWIKK